MKPMGFHSSMPSTSRYKGAGPVVLGREKIITGRNKAELSSLRAETKP
jgi:hypothetical protein